MIERFRDLQANEQTFLAWVRTAMAIVGFGVAAGRLGPDRAPVWTEVTLLVSGAVVCALAYWRMRATRRRILSASPESDAGAGADTLLLVLLLALFGLFAAFALHTG